MSHVSRLIALRITGAEDLVALVHDPENGSSEKPICALNHLKDCDSIATQVANWLRESVYDGTSLTMLLPSDRFVCVEVADQELLRLDKTSLLFAIEPEFPFDIEDAVVEVVRGKESLVAIALEWPEIRELLESLSKCGIAIDSIRPAAWEIHRELSRRDADSRHCNVFAFDDRFEFFDVSQSRATRWFSRSIGSRLENGLVFQCDSLIHDSEVVVVNWVDSPLVDLGPPTSNVRHEDTGEQPIDVLTLALVSNCSSDRALEFCRDELALASDWEQLQRPITAFVGAIVCLLILVNIGLAWRTTQNRQQIAQHDERLRTSYQSAFPGERVPRGIAKRLQSEEARLLRQRAANIDIDESESALQQFVTVVDSVPDEPRVFVSRIRTEPHRIELEGFVNQPSDWNRIAQNLRESGVLLDAPEERAQSSGETWFRLIGVPRDEEAARED